MSIAIVSDSGGLIGAESVNKYFSHYVLKKFFLIYSKKILEKIICKEIIASLYLGKIKKTETIAILTMKNNIKKLI